MHIALEAKRFFESGTGFGTYSRTLVRDLADHFPQNRYFLYAPESERNLSMASRAHSLEVDRVVSHESVRVVFPPDKAKLYWKLIGARRTLRENQIDLYHGLAHQIPRSVRLSAVPKVVTIHDLIYRHFPDLFPGENLDLLDQQLRRVCTLSDHIIAVSQNTKSDLIEFFSIAPSKISVIYQACDKRYQIQVPSDQKKEIKNKYQLPDGFLLYVGSMSERKNLLTVVKAIKRIPTRERTPLVVIGQRTSYTRNVLTYAGQHGLSDAIIFPKNVTTQDLPAIYQSSKIFLYPSLYEGFGIPVLEAITSGTPVVTSATSAMPEAGGPSARLVEPTDVDSIAEAIQEILKDSELTKNMIKGGRHYAKRFRGDVISKQMMGLYSSEVKKFENR